jgi:transposase-like protein
MWPQPRRSSRKRSHIKVMHPYDHFRWLCSAVRKMRTGGLLPKRTKLRSSKYLNNLIEQGHRGIKSRTRPMLGFKNFACAATTITGIELLRRIRKDQFALGRLNLNGQAAPAVWNSVLAAYAYARVLSCSLSIFALEPYRAVPIIL